MDQGKRKAGRFRPKQSRMDRVTMGIQNRILAVPPANFSVVPDTWPDQVKRFEAVLGKQVGPNILPLLVDMARPALLRDCRREENGWS